MASSLSDKTNKVKEEKKDSKNGLTDDQKTEEKSQEPAIKFKNCDASDDLKMTITSLYKKHMHVPTLPRMCEAIKKDLDEKIPKGWVVFAGMHLVGVCSFIKNTMVEFEVNGTAFVIFQTFCPS